MLPDGTTVVGVYGGIVHVVTSKGASLTLSPGQSLVLYTNGVTLMLEPGVSIIVDSHGNAHAYEDAPGLLFAATLLGNDTLGYLGGPGTVAPFFPDVSSQPGHQGTQDGGGTTTYPSTYPSH
ncbi:MAG: hypothetical protein HYU64_08295 [Armatimonadetes bacterium]|nr:hypothetical protein [Armatimonadota bacterium]